MLLTQLSFSVNAVLTAVAVRVDVCRSNRTKARKEKTSVPKETPYESWNAVFWLLFFCFGKKSKRIKNNEFFSSPQVPRQIKLFLPKIWLWSKKKHRFWRLNDRARKWRKVFTYGFTKWNAVKNSLERSLIFAYFLSRKSEKIIIEVDLRVRVEE